MDAQISTTFYSILAQFGGATFIVLGLSGWLGKLWVQRILAQDKAKYDIEMEKLKNNYLKEFESAKALNLKLENTLTTSNATYMESRKLYAEKRMSAICDAWQKIQDLNNKAPLAFGLYGMLGNAMFSGENSKDLQPETELMHINKLRKETSIDFLKLFLDDKAVQIFNANSLLIMRVTIFLRDEFAGRSSDFDWRTDEAIRDSLKQALEDDYETLRKEEWDLGEVQIQLQNKFLKHLKKLATGSDLAEEALQHSHGFVRTLDQIRKIEIETEKNVRAPGKDKH